MPSDKKLCVAIVVGETSGDLLGSGLMAELKKRHHNIEFVGVGGSKMEAQGLSSMFPMERLSVIGITEVFGRIPELLKRRSKLIKDIIAIKPDVFIGIDAPDFNLTIELKLRRAGIKTIHYVSPSVWAWKQKRIFKIKEACDLVLALFPFETKIYKEHNIPVAFVGHPLADSIPLELDKNAIKAELGFSDSTPVVALMPGSRAGEVSRLAPIFLETALKIVDKYPSVQFVIPCANASRREQLESLLKGYKLPIRLLDGQSQKALGACDVVLIASGTATLEALLCVRPMVVAYKLTTLSFYLIKSLFKMPYVSIPNILAGRFVVPELLQHDATPEKLFNALVPLLDGNIKDQVENFKATHIELKQNASEKAAEAVLKLIATV
ncbi:lipid-A-disaccharide synthase [Entomomonas moraniae]|uniref:Lipid-A-disaccharide synthase n=1 Tax=Entomomonas moraniae TaxID=2213226 RepID=A0A3Q9JN18_9GAMM|nr:lipid-A-disaccharide synthase [Entomomonas moraniae]AZS52261.1 lipid-A-disaccharide synthase [Entomomonas moraniae]